MATDARNLIRMYRLQRDRDRLNHILMAMPARLLGNLPASFGQPDRLVKTVGRKIERVPKTIGRFGQILPNQIGRSMTIVAGGNALVTRFLPTVVLFVHDMAIRTISRVVGHIRIPLGVNKRIDSDGDRRADSNAHNS